MSSRVEAPRSGGPIGIGRHKQDNERRNQELQKRALDGPLSKSFTEDPHTRTRVKKKEPMAGKSFMKATSSSSLKKPPMNSKDASPTRGRKRDPSPSKVMSKSDHQVMRRTSSRKSVDSSHRKSMDSSKLSVFDRLAMTDCNKETSKTETQVSKAIKRRSGVFSDTNGLATVPLRRDSNVRRSARSNGKRDSKAEISEKHKSEEKPESSDKDSKDECTTAKADGCRAIKASESPQQKHEPALSPAGPHVGAAATATTTAHQPPPLIGGSRGNKGGMTRSIGSDSLKTALTGSDSLMSIAAAVPSVCQATQVPSARPTTSTAPPNHSQQLGKRPTTIGEVTKTKPREAITHKAAPTQANKPTTGKGVTGPVPVTKPEPAAVTPRSPRREAKKVPPTTLNLVDGPPKTHKPASPVDTKANSPSVAAVSRLAERVNSGQVKPNSNGNSKKVLDDDKDVCEDDKVAEDREFYRIKVQTRLVSYENNTLVIKKTSNPEMCHESPSTDTNGSSGDGSLQTSSAEASPPVGVRNQGQHDELTEEDEAHEEEGEGGFTRSRSLRLKMSSFMNKGKSFLSDVYSSTHQSIQPHLSQLPEMTRSFSQKMSRSLTSEGSGSDTLSIMSLSSSISSHGDTSSNLPVTDTDSGFYSIHTTPDQACHTSDTELDGATVEMNETYLSDTDEINNNSTDVLTHHVLADEGDILVLTEPVQHTQCDAHGSTPHEELTHKGMVGPGVDASADILINDDWVKRCIVNCSCQCRRPNPSKDLPPSSEGSSIDSGHGSNDSLDSSNSDVTSGADRGEGNGNAYVSAATDGSKGKCQCECHSDATIPMIQSQMPKEVIDLLDADHARMWWTITGNFGNILPIDWSKTYTRQQYLTSLNLNESKDTGNNSSDEGEGGEEEDVAQDLDLHHLILTGLNEEPVKSAEEVIREIDDIMQEGSSSEDEGLEETMSCSTETQSTQPEMRPLPPPFYEEKLKNLSVNELNEHYMELEVVIRQYSETLINQLALRDELEYKKELKNSFISLLLQVQNKRRNFNVEKKQKKKYLTTVIPYDVGHGPPSNQTLQILIKILTAINEDSPTVPTLLTDYILKVLCPS